MPALPDIWVLQDISTDLSGQDFSRAERLVSRVEIKARQFRSGEGRRAAPAVGAERLKKREGLPTFLLGRHPHGSVNANRLTIQHIVLDDVLHQSSVLFRLAQAGRKWRLLSQ